MFQLRRFYVESFVMYLVTNIVFKDWVAAEFELMYLNEILLEQGVCSQIPSSSVANSKTLVDNIGVWG